MLLVASISVSHVIALIQPTVSTDKADYAPGETVLISGEGFAYDAPMMMSIERPDGETESCDVTSCNARFLDGPLTSDATGSFSDYPYLLNGIEGEYTITASDGINDATATFTDIITPCPTACTNAGYAISSCVQSPGVCTTGGGVTVVAGNGGCNQATGGGSGTCCCGAAVSHDPHAECVNNQCVEVAGSGIDQCYDTLDCGGTTTSSTTTSTTTLLETTTSTTTTLYARPCDSPTDLCSWVTDGNPDNGLPLGSPDNSGCGLSYNTFWALDTQATATCTFDGTGLGGADLYISIDNDVVSCTLNTVSIFSISHEGCAAVDPRTIGGGVGQGYQVPLTGLNSGTNTIVCTVNDRGTMSHFDACVIGTECTTAADCDDSDDCTTESCVEGSCTHGNAVQGTECGEARNCPEDDCNGFFAEFYPDDGHDTCDGQGNCVQYSCAMEDSYCTDNDDADGVNTLTCGAECDQNSDCQAKIESDTCYYDGSCDLQTDCACDYSNEPCPEAGTIIGDDCYYGTRNCVNSESPGGCTLNVDPMGCYDTCDPVLGPIDTIGPVTSNLDVDPNPNNGLFDITATATDSCTNIDKAEYFAGDAVIPCGPEGTGISMDASDGNFDALIEDVEKYFSSAITDGSNVVWVRSHDAAGNWGNCIPFYFETDRIPPERVFDYCIDGNCPPDEYLMCGNDGTLTVTVCDSESNLQGGEYFIDMNIPPQNIPAPWSGFWLNITNNYIDKIGWHCSDLTGPLHLGNLSEGTHYINQIRGKDTVENWGKIYNQNLGMSFIKDTTEPATDKQLNPQDSASVVCDITEANGETITNGCYYVKQWTTIVLNASDPDPQQTGEFAGNVIIKYIVYWKNDDCDSASGWTIDQQGQSNVDESVTITLTEDSCHLVEYWAEDLCDNEEEHHFELDIVDTAAPEITKEVVGDQVDGNGNPIHKYINDETQVILTCEDVMPHPVDDVTLYWEHYYAADADCVVSDWGTPLETGSENSQSDPVTKTFTGLEDSCHKFVYWCEDALGNTFGPIEEIDAVDNTPPELNKDIGTPIYVDGEEVYISLATPITLTCVDRGNHPVDDVTIYWRWIVNDVPQSEESINAESVVLHASEDCYHTLEYWCEDSLGNLVEKIEYDIVDAKAPISSSEVVGPQYENDSKLYIDGVTNVALSCEDQMPHPSGVKKIEYRYFINDTILVQDWTTYANPFSFPEESHHTLEYRCIDNVDNVEIANVREYYVDHTPPTTTKIYGTPFYINGSLEWASSLTEITLTADDGTSEHASGVQYTMYRVTLVDDSNCYASCVAEGSGGFNTYSVPFTIGEDSCHLIEFYSVDNVEKTEQTKKQCVFIDNKPPESSSEVLGPQYDDGQKLYIDGVTEIQLSCEDQLPHPSGVQYIAYKYSVDGSPIQDWTTYTGPFSFPEESHHVLEYRCVDNVDNMETANVREYYVDHTKPVTTKTYGTPYVTDGISEWITSQTPVTLTADDGSENHDSGVATTYYRVTLVADSNCYTSCVDAGTGGFNTYSVPFTIGEDSCHLIEFYSVDRVNKTEQTKRQCTFVDNTKPATSKTVSEPKVSGTGGIDYYITADTVIELSCADQMPHPVDDVTLYWAVYYNTECIDSQSEAWSLIDSGKTDGVKTITGLSDSCHKISYFCVDALGNTEVEHVEIDAVDNTPPASVKTVGDPKVDKDDQYDYYITQQTNITIDCSDPAPHPVDDVTIHWVISGPGGGTYSDNSASVTFT
ncbi:MAG: hypothetical protein ABH834_00685, partial [Candidatus Altiarchaeota archaeon]